MPAPDRYLRCVLTLALLISFATAGCSGGSSGPSPVPVSGKITVNGQPLAGGTVNFTPVDSKKSLPGHAVIGPDGSYAAMTHKVKDGLTPGEYIVWFDEAEPTDKKANAAGTIPTANRSPVTSKMKTTIDSKGGVVNLDVQGPKPR